MVSLSGTGLLTDGVVLCNQVKTAGTRLGLLRWVWHAAVRQCRWRLVYKAKMKFVRNAGTDRVVDVLQSQLAPGVKLDVLTPSFSLFAHEALRPHWAQVATVRMVLSAGEADACLLGTEADRPARNRLQVPFLARQLAQWLRAKADIRCASGPVVRVAMGGTASFTSDTSAAVGAVGCLSRAA